MEYYTYAYLREDGTPYYIGKGKGYRVYAKSRTTPVPKDKNKIIFLKKNLTEEESLKHEEYMIFIFGRKDLGTGILRNRCNGGKGTPKRVISDEEREKMRTREMGNKRCVGRILSEETKRKIGEANSKPRERKNKSKKPEGRPLIENPSPKTLSARKWRENNREKYKNYQRNYYYDNKTD